MSRPFVPNMPLVWQSMAVPGARPSLIMILSLEGARIAPRPDYRLIRPHRDLPTRTDIAAMMLAAAWMIASHGFPRKPEGGSCRPRQLAKHGSYRSDTETPRAVATPPNFPHGRVGGLDVPPEPFHVEQRAVRPIFEDLAATDG